MQHTLNLQIPEGAVLIPDTSGVIEDGINRDRLNPDEDRLIDPIESIHAEADMNLVMQFFSNI